MEPDVRAFMDQRFGFDFSKIRIHTDAQAADSAAMLNARAFTLGKDIVFGAGEYGPRSEPGRSLLAHELAHVVQDQSGPAPLQGKWRISRSSDDAEAAAAGAARAVVGGEHGSSALQLRNRLRTSASRQPTLHRVATWAGDYTTDNYDLVSEAALEGVDIKLRFKPNEHVDAELIGMTQTARSTEKGTPVPASTFYDTDAEKKAFEAYRITKDPNKGTMIDRLVSRRIPLYGTNDPGAGGTSLAGGTETKNTQHGFHFTDKAGKHDQDAWIHDRPTLAPAMKESGQVFETSALAVKGNQVNTYYGSVQWGWTKDPAGKVNKLPLTVVSNDVPRSVFNEAAGIWNKAKTSTGDATIPLPIVEGKFTNTVGVWLVSNPSHYKTTTIAKLEKNARVEVTDKGDGKKFNNTTDLYKWWKVTVVDGTHVGKVGWVMQTLLSDSKAK